MRSSRFNAFVISAFAAAALLLSALGVFGVFVLGVTSRVREVGIRMALGATGSDIARMFLRQAVGPITVGVFFGTAGAIALGRLVDSLLFGLALHRLTWLVPGALLHQVRVRRQGCHPQDR